MITKIRPKEYINLLRELFSLSSPPPIMVLGRPGIGKTTIIKTVAKEFCLEVIDFYLPFRESSDLIGCLLPKRAGEEEITVRSKPEIIVLAERAFERSGKPPVILFDEFTQASPNTLKALFQLLLEKKVESFELPKGTIIVLAGNEDYDGVGWSLNLSEFPLAFLDRAIKVELEMHVEDFLMYAEERNFNQDLIALVRWRPTILEKFTPRFIERVNNYFTFFKDEVSKKILMGEELWVLWQTYQKIVKKISPLEILRKPEMLKNLKEEEKLAFFSQLFILLKEKENWTYFEKLIDDELIPPEWLVAILKSLEEVRSYLLSRKISQKIIDLVKEYS